MSGVGGRQHGWGAAVSGGWATPDPVKCHSEGNSHFQFSDLYAMYPSLEL
jgi:hypothetical protein